MNRRSAFKVAIGACAAMLLPWRKASGKPKYGIDYWIIKPEVDQVERIKRLLEKQPHQMHSLLPELEAAKARWAKPGDADGAIKIVTYRPHVERRRGCDLGIIEIWWSTPPETCEERYTTRLVALTEDVAASLADKKLSKALLDALLVSISSKPTDRSRWGGGFNGMTICISSEGQQGVRITPALYTQYLRLSDINTLGGLSKT